MATEENETTVDDGYAVRIPSSVREDLDLRPGDQLQWRVDEAGRLVATVVDETTGDDATALEPVDMGETDAVDVTDEYDWS